LRCSKPKLPMIFEEDRITPAEAYRQMLGL
jgi:hypothetical protein